MKESRQKRFKHIDDLCIILGRPARALGYLAEVKHQKAWYARLVEAVSAEEIKVYLISPLPQTSA